MLNLGDGDNEVMTPPKTGGPLNLSFDEAPLKTNYPPLNELPPPPAEVERTSLSPAVTALAITGVGVVLVALVAVAIVIGGQRESSSSLDTADPTATSTTTWVGAVPGTKVPGTSTSVPGTNSTEATAQATSKAESIAKAKPSVTPGRSTATSTETTAKPSATTTPTTAGGPGTGGDPITTDPPSIRLTAQADRNTITGSIEVHSAESATCTLTVRNHGTGAEVTKGDAPCAAYTVTGLTWYDSYDVVATAANRVGSTPSDIITVVIGMPPTLVSPIGNGKGSTNQGAWDLLAAPDPGAPVSPAVVLHGPPDPAETVTVLCQRGGPEYLGSGIYDYVQLANGARGWISDDAVVETPDNAFDSRLTQACPPGV